MGDLDLLRVLRDFHLLQMLSHGEHQLAKVDAVHLAPLAVRDPALTAAALPGPLDVVGPRGGLDLGGHVVAATDVEHPLAAQMGVSAGAGLARATATRATTGTPRRRPRDLASR